MDSQIVENGCDDVRSVSGNKAIVDVNYQDGVFPIRPKPQVHTGVTLAVVEALLSDESIKFCVPAPRCLLQPIHALRQSADLLFFSR